MYKISQYMCFWFLSIPIHLDFFFFLIKSEQENMVSVREGEKFSVAC